MGTIIIIIAFKVHITISTRTAVKRSRFITLSLCVFLTPTIFLLGRSSVFLYIRKNICTIASVAQIKFKKELME